MLVNLEPILEPNKGLILTLFLTYHQIIFFKELYQHYFEICIDTPWSQPFCSYTKLLKALFDERVRILSKNLLIGMKCEPDLTPILSIIFYNRKISCRQFSIQNKSCLQYQVFISYNFLIGISSWNETFIDFQFLVCGLIGPFLMESIVLF